MITFNNIWTLIENIASKFLDNIHRFLKLGNCHLFLQSFFNTTLHVLLTLIKFYKGVVTEPKVENSIRLTAPRVSQNIIMEHRAHHLTDTHQVQYPNRMNFIGYNKLYGLKTWLTLCPHNLLSGQRTHTVLAPYSVFLLHFLTPSLNFSHRLYPLDPLCYRSIIRRSP